MKPAGIPDDTCQCAERCPDRDIGAGAESLPCILDAGHTEPHRDAFNRTWGSAVQAADALEHDPLETHVEVSDDTRTVSLFVDGYEIPLSADPGAVEDNVDVLRRVSAACGQAIRLLRTPEARKAAVAEMGAPVWLNGSQIQTRQWPPSH